MWKTLLLDAVKSPQLTRDRLGTPEWLMRLTVTFETWLLGDGVYPPLAQGQYVNIALELQARRLTPLSGTATVGWQRLDEAKYQVTAEIIGVLGDRDRPTLALDAGGLRMYVEGCELHNPAIGGKIQAIGNLGFDYYWWSEILALKDNAPDLFHKFYIERLRRVPIPKRFVQRSNDTVTSPTRVDPAEWDPERVEEVARMSEDPDDFDFFLVDLTNELAIPHDVPRTFIS